MLHDACWSQSCANFLWLHERKYDVWDSRQHIQPMCIIIGLSKSVCITHRQNQLSQYCYSFNLDNKSLLCNCCTLWYRQESLFPECVFFQEIGHVPFSSCLYLCKVHSLELSAFSVIVLSNIILDHIYVRAHVLSCSVMRKVNIASNSLI